MTRPVCLITGATDGVGRVTALELARRGFHVVVAARNADKAEKLRRELDSTMSSGSLDSIITDLNSLTQVRRLAATFRERHQKLDLLINNAGVFLPRRTITEDGHEAMLQVNYLSHFLLTNLLLDELGASEHARVINLSSSVYSAGKFAPDNFESEKKFSVLGTYAATKLYMLMFTQQLAARLAGTQIAVNAVHPGIVRTQMMLNAPGVFRFVSYLSLPFSISPERGAATTVHVATSPALAGVSGQYFVGAKPVKTKSALNTPENRELLWDLSLAATREVPAHATRAV